MNVFQPSHQKPLTALAYEARTGISRIRLIRECSPGCNPAASPVPTCAGKKIQSRGQKMRLLSLLAVVAIFAPIVGAQRTARDIATGNDLWGYLQDCDKVHDGFGRGDAAVNCTYARGYISGVVHYVNEACMLHPDPQTCPEVPTKVTVGQLADVVSVYLNGHPQTRQADSALLILKAITVAWRKPRVDSSSKQR